jgi:hypothetical protein
MLLTKLATSFLKYNIKPFLLLWKKILPSHPILIGFPSDSFNSKHQTQANIYFNIREKMLLDMLKTPFFFYRKKDGDPLPS